MSFLLAAAAVSAGALSMSPIAGALAPRVVGMTVPTRITDVLGYLSLSEAETQAPVTCIKAPCTTVDVTSAKPLKELAALSLGSAAAVAAVTYVVLRKVLG